jgi:hypothetical protein
MHANAFFNQEEKEVEEKQEGGDMAARDVSSFRIAA